MSAKFKTFTFNAAAKIDKDALALPSGVRGVLGVDAPTDASRKALENLPSDEGAARHYAEQLLASTGDDDLTATIAPQETPVMPGLAVCRTEELPAAGARSVHFEQQARGIPIFGTTAVVELEASTRRLNSFDAQLTNEPDVSPVASVSAVEALGSIADYCGADLNIDEVKEAPTLCYFAAEDGANWHLTYHFKNIPAAPKDVVAAMSKGHVHGHGIGPSPREDFLRFDYLVDAHTSEVVYYFSAQPFLDVPVRCHGHDEFGTHREFFGRDTADGYELVDPLRNIETYDHGLEDIDADPPAAPIGHNDTDFASTNTAGVSAHYHATLVFDFFNHVLKRNGIDGKGMRLVSHVNCTYVKHSQPPVWRNAVWWNKHMWYGQTEKAGGEGFESYARFLDVIAHELTHGVTESTSNLVYRDESGALNESFSDIFGVIVANWYPGEPNPLSSWNWEIGAGLGSGGGPLRDMSDPTKTGDPDHWDDRKYIGTPDDNGGVHTNSNIHNKAAYNLFTAVDADGNQLLSPADTGLLYYLTLTRLSRLATFRDCLRVLRSVAATYFRGNQENSTNVLNAIDEAYAKVGIA